MKRRLVASIVALLACSPVAQGDSVRRSKPILVKLTPGVVRTLEVRGVENGNFMAMVANPDIADVFFGPKNVFMFVGKKEGTTNIVVLDKDSGSQILSALLLVGEGRRVSVRVHTGIDKSETYLCTKTGCEPSGATTSTDISPTGGGESGEAKASQ